MKTKVISLTNLNLPNKKYVDLRTKDQRLCFNGLIDYYRDRSPKMCGESIKRSWTIPLAHSYISSELLRRPFVRRVSFFWGGIEILLKDEQRRGELVLCLGKLIKNLFPEENVKIIPPA